MVDRHSVSRTDSSTHAAQQSARGAEGALAPAPTLLETQLDSIALTLTKMKTRLRTAPSWDQLSEGERAELQVAMSRVEDRVHEVGRLIRRDNEMTLELHGHIEPAVAEFSAHA